MYVRLSYCVPVVKPRLKTIGRGSPRLRTIRPSPICEFDSIWFIARRIHALSRDSTVASCAYCHITVGPFRFSKSIRGGLESYAVRIVRANLKNPGSLGGSGVGLDNVRSVPLNGFIICYVLHGL